MQHESELVEILSDLAGMHENRIEEYQDLVPKISEKDTDLKAMVEKKITESRELTTELVAEINKITNDTVKPPFHSEKLHRLWMEIRSFFTGTARKSILGYAECVEHAVFKSYQEALESDATMEIDVRRLINNHYSLVKASYAYVKNKHEHAEETVE